MNKIWVVGLFSLLFDVSGICQGLFESATSETGDRDTSLVDWNGYTRTWVFGGGKVYDYASVFAELAIRPTLVYKSAFFHADLRVRSGFQFGADTLIIQSKELYAGYKQNKWSIYFGNQIVQWGRADGFNPTNNITPNNYFYLSAEPDDQKISNTLVRADYFITPQIEFELIGIPVYKPSVYRYDLFTINPVAQFIPSIKPKQTYESGSVAGRLNFEFPRTGFSLSYFNGYDPFYGFRIKELDLQQQTPIIRYIPDFYRKQTFGGDFSVSAEPMIFRGELAYNQTRNYKNNMYIPNPDLAYVLGMEFTFLDITSIFEYVGKHTFDFNALPSVTLIDPSDPEQQLQYFIDRVNIESSLFNRKIFYQQEENNHAIFLSLSRMFAHETVSIEVSGYHNFTSDENLIRGSLKWNINDAMELRLGENYMMGPGNSIFDLSGTVFNGAFIEFKVSF